MEMLNSTHYLVLKAGSVVQCTDDSGEIYECVLEKDIEVTNECNSPISVTKIKKLPPQSNE